MEMFENVSYLKDKLIYVLGAIQQRQLALRDGLLMKIIVVLVDAEDWGDSNTCCDE